MHVIFKQAGAADILTYLLNHERPNQKEILDNTDCNTITVIKAGSLLKELNLVVIEKEKYNQNIYSLTAKGHKIAVLFKEINDLL